MSSRPRSSPTTLPCWPRCSTSCTASGEAAEGDSGLEDFGDHLLPRLVERGKTFAHPLDGYWRDLGQPHHYLGAHRDVLRDDVGVLNVDGWPILTHQPQRAPARILDGAEVTDSLVSPGSKVAGQVRRSVLGPGVVVEADAYVEDSVVFADCVIGSGARINASIIDTRCVVEGASTVGSPEADLESSDQLTLVGRDCVIRAGATVPAGARLEPGTTA